ncbi:hypothetical protein EYE40_14650 [Glaciihabitans arcticus]|uniref:Uncharacterized protein n=1 Tax=Glaciihabitans arcticus TaxID=2668039 RepID=A0A4Q9GM58_9MICO|nr:hypothetical protein [Glaciihabitans arcticus]TBN55443.1 hypothetical protein EYE40_14650 [Glaciihabitans arcticus]
MSATPQSLDPLGGITARLVVIAAGIFAIVTAVVMSVVGASQISSIPLALAAILVLVATVGFFVRATSAFRPPFNLASHFVVFGGSLVAVLLNALSQWGTNTYVRDDWGPVAMAIVIFSLGSYRAWPELLGSALFSAVALAVIAVAESGSLTTPVPTAVYALAAATPVLASGVAAAAFSATLVGILVAWRAGLDAEKPAPLASSGVLADAAASSHLGYLHGEVIPFLESIVESGAISDRDGPRARSLSAELRALMVLDAEQSWAEQLVDSLDDPDRIAQRLSPGQRGSLRALVAHLRGAENSVSGSIALAMTPGGGELTARIAPGSNPRVRLAPFVAVARGIFPTAIGEFTGTEFCLRFTL